jgi:hypothetical protein
MRNASHLSVVRNDDENNTHSNPEGGRFSEGNRLISFADEFTTAVRSKDSQHYLTFDETPHLAIPLDGAGSPAMQEIALRHMSESAKWASGTAKTLAADYFNAQCLKAPVADVALRASYIDGAIYLDTCWPNNKVIAVSAIGVSAQDTCPAVFVRNGVSSALPELADSSLPLTALLDYIRISRTALPAQLRAW